MMPRRGAVALIMGVAAVILIGVGAWLHLTSDDPSRGALPASEIAAAQQADGERVWAERCVACHQPGGIGVALTPEVLAARRTALGLYDYLRIAMPHEAPGSLPDRDYWNVTAFLLVEHGLAPDTVPVARENAGDVALIAAR